MIAQLSRDYISKFPRKTFTRLVAYFFIEGRPATTKGRWFNAVTFTFLKIASHFTHKKEAQTPVFITGTGRSGSTILGVVLSTHPAFGFLNEPKATWHLTEPLDDVIGSYTSQQGRFLLDATQATAQKSAFIRSVYSTFLFLTGSSRVLDKYPEMIFRISYINQLFESPKFIFLYRDAYETIGSTAKWSEQHHDSQENADWWGVADRKWKLMVNELVPEDPMLASLQKEIAAMNTQTDRAAVEWIVTMNHGLKMMKNYPDQICPVSYEELVGNTELTLKRICDFCNLPNDERMQQYAKATLHPSKGSPASGIHPALQRVISDVTAQLNLIALN